MPIENLAAALYEQAEALQDEAKDLRERIGRLYARAGQIKALAIRAAEAINTNPEPKSTETSNAR
jgi:uncharacterized Zn finger protein